MSTLFYDISSGQIADKNGVLGNGYSGQPEYKNNPAATDIKAKGPIPVGQYHIGAAYESKRTGPFTIMLQAFRENVMFGRGDFRIHGDSKAHPGTASKGCIICARAIRDLIIARGYDVLMVTA